MINSIASFVFVLGLLIFVHELGHFVTAKMVGIRVERFSLGFPPRMFGKKIGETDYCISWLPLGGYVKMAGMVDESLDANIKGEPWEFQSKPIWQRVIVISAGSIMNILTAVVIFAVLALLVGLASIDGTKVGEVLPGKPAESVGIRSGDMITSVAGQEVDEWQQLVTIIHAKPNEPLVVEWQREGEVFSAEVTPELEPERQIGLIGVGPKVITRQLGLGESIEYGFVKSYTTTRDILATFKQIFTGEVAFKEAIGGPLTIFQVTRESAKRGFDYLLLITAFISLNLGLFNLLPFPVLDGGHLVFLFIEGVRRKPLSVKARVVIQQIGMAFLLALMVFVIFNDIRRWDQIKELFKF